MKNLQIILTLVAALLSLVLAKAEGLPSELASLQEKRERKIAEIDRIYLQELEKLKITYTKRGDLESANLVVSIIAALTKGTDGENWMEKDTRWLWGSGGELVLRKNGTASHTGWNRPGSWRKKDDHTILLDGPHGSIRITFDEDGIGRAVHLATGNITSVTPKK